MRIGIVSVFVDYHRNGNHHRGVLQPQIGPLIAGLVPPDTEIDLVNDAWTDPDWGRDYDLLFISALHSDFDRARQISHYFRRRGARTVLGGTFASTYPELVEPYFDTIAIGDPEEVVPRICADFARGELAPRYVSGPYDGARVPVPRLDLACAHQVLPLGLEVTRGCPFTCEFCVLTGTGTRFHTRPVRYVARDIAEARRMLRGRVPWHLRRMALLYDNNFAGSFAYVREVCAALAPLGIRWATSVTFNAAADRRLLRVMADAGCRVLFTGLESFNPAVLADMDKTHNRIDGIRRLIDGCHAEGILLASGQILSPRIDDCAYLDALPDLLSECGLHVPTYVCFETPFPGTPHFRRLAAAPAPVFMPDALLRDFTSYTLVVRPARETPEDFVAGYRRLLNRLYAWPRRVRKLVFDVPRLLAGGHVMGAVSDIVDQYQENYRPDPGRTYLAGTDREPPEAHAIPWAADDFRDDQERARILDPWRVTDAAGRPLACWNGARATWQRKGIPSGGPQAPDLSVGRAVSALT